MCPALGQLSSEMVMPGFTSISGAFQAARARACVAQSIEVDLLHMAVDEARDQGMSIREAATALRVPKSTVARHWREDHRCGNVPPIWGNTDEYESAQRAVWAHAPEYLDEWVPYEWEDTIDAGPTVRLRVRGDQ